jgi:hypothetical protein
MNSLALCCRVSSILASSGRDSDLNRGKKITAIFASSLPFSGLTVLHFEC